MTWRRKTETLTAIEAEQLASHLAELDKAGLPLESGLRAAACEVPSPRVSRSLRELADLFEQGQDLEAATLQRRGNLPSYFRGYIAAAAKTGKFGEVLSQLVERHRTRRELRASISSAVAYPLLVLLLVLLLTIAASLYLIDDFDALYRELEIALPLPTRILFWVGGIGKWFLLGAAVVACVTAALARRLVGAARWRRFTAALPVFGPLWHWSAVAELCQIMAVLLEHGTPLPTAAQIAADAVEDASVSESSREWADGVERGQSLSSLVAESRWLPPPLAPFIRWGEQTESLAESFDSAAKLFEGRVHVRASMLRNTLPAIAYLVVASLVGFLATSLLVPLVGLIGALSGDLSGEASGQPAGQWDLPLLLVSLIPLGLLLLLIASWIGRRRVGEVSRLRYGTMTAGWVFTIAGLVVTVGGLTMFSAAAAIVVGVVAGAAVNRFERAERRSLLLAITIATKRGIPLPSVIESFFIERSAGMPAVQLANLLQSGVPLADALRQSRRVLTLEAILAADLGTELNDVSQALETVVPQTDEREAETRWALDKLFYLIIIALVGAYIMTIIFITVLPTFDQMFQEFQFELPGISQQVIKIGRGFHQHWYLFALAVPLLAAGGILAVLGYVGYFPRDLPLLRRFLLREEGARVMRALALTVRHNRPLPNSVAWLADRYPATGVSARLRQSGKEIERGNNAWDALRSAGLIKKADATVLKSAERVGNLAWALEEMAASSNRRFALRIRAAVNILFPILLLSFGTCVFFLAVGILLPISDIISNLTY